MSKRKPRLPKGIDQLPSGKFRVRVHPYPGTTYTTLEDAEKRLALLRRAKETNTPVEELDAARQTLRDLINEHFAAEERNLEEATINVYKALIRKHIATHHIIDLPLGQIGPKTVEDFRDDLLAAGAGASSVRKTLTLLHTVMERAVRLHKKGYNPVKAVKKPSGQRKKIVRHLSPEQVERIRAATTSERDALLIGVLAYTGMRPGEALALTWGDVRTRTIAIDKATSPSGAIKSTKTDKPRTPPLMEPLRDDLRSYRTAAGNPPDSALIFPKTDGSPWTKYDYDNWRKRRFAKAAEDAGVEVKDPYTLRHSAAALWIQDRINPAVGAEYMGHSIPQFLGTYGGAIADLDPKDTRSAAELIQDARRDKPVTTLRVIAGQAQSSDRRKATSPKAAAS